MAQYQCDGAVVDEGDAHHCSEFSASDGFAEEGFEGGAELFVEGFGVVRFGGADEGGAVSFPGAGVEGELADDEGLSAGFEEGVRIFDSSLAGLGGCPYAPGASGNVATEDLVDLFKREGVRTGIDLDALVDASDWLERDVLARPLPGRVFRARLGEGQRAHRSI